jgi:hypothetical protein
VAGVRVKGEGEEGLYFVYVYENRAMKPVVLGREGKMTEEKNLIKIHCKHICKCRNDIPCTTNIC